MKRSPSTPGVPETGLTREYEEESLGISSTHGRLEARLAYDASRAFERGVLALSPHPRFGGDLENNVIRALPAPLVARAGAAVLRFNYHGVGGSESPFGDAMASLRHWLQIAETDAYESVVDDARAAFGEIACEEVHLVGYSFGAVLAARLAADPPEGRRIASLTLLALASGSYDFDFVARISTPTLAIHSRNDFATPLSLVESRLERFAGPVALHVIEESDHFFRGREEEIAGCVAEFVLENSTRAGLAGSRS